jgi:hypothetical protein
MTDADSLRAEISQAIDLAERVQATALAYREAIEQLQSACLLLDLHSDNPFSRSIGRMAPMIGHELGSDAEITGQVKTELQVWLPHV